MSDSDSSDSEPEDLRPLGEAKLARFISIIKMLSTSGSDGDDVTEVQQLILSEAANDAIMMNTMSAAQQLVLTNAVAKANLTRDEFQALCQTLEGESAPV